MYCVVDDTDIFLPDIERKAYPIFITFSGSSRTAFPTIEYHYLICLTCLSFGFLHRATSITSATAATIIIPLTFIITIFVVTSFIITILSFIVPITQTFPRKAKKVYHRKPHHSDWPLVEAGWKTHEGD